MKRIFRTGTVTAALLCGAVSGTLLAQNSTPPADSATPQQQAPAPPSQPRASTIPTSAAGGQGPVDGPRIAPGSIIPVALIKSIDAKKAKTGDEIVALVTMDMKSATGEVMVPKDTKVVGHVTEAQPRSKEQKESQLGIAFDQAVLKNQQVRLPMSIQAVIGQQTNNNDNSGGGVSAPSASPSPSGTGTGASSPMSGRSPSQSPQPQASPEPSGGGTSQDSGGGNKRPTISAQTQGVVGISNLNLSPNSNAKQGSTLTSEKNNVKLESGTMLLLRVNQ
jgi:hypothetical protein